MKRTFIQSFIAVAVAMIAIPSFSFAETFDFNDAAGRNTVRFVLDAPLETINGLTNTVSGTAKTSGSTVSGSVKVPIAPIKTGIDLRDEHMRSERWLNAGKYPEISFTFKNVSTPKFVDQKAVKVVAEGQFSLKGVTKKEKVTLTVTYFKQSEKTKALGEGNLIRVKGTFKIKLADYGIDRTEALVLKVGEYAEIDVDITGFSK